MRNHLDLLRGDRSPRLCPRTDHGLHYRRCLGAWIAWPHSPLAAQGPPESAVNLVVDETLGALWNSKIT